MVPRGRCLLAPYRELLFHVLDRGLERPCAPGGLILHGLHSLEEGGDIGHHHLHRKERPRENENNEVHPLLLLLDLMPRDKMLLSEEGAQMRMFPLFLCVHLSPCTPPPHLPRHGALLYLGGTLELVHGGVISRLAGGSLGGTNQI